MENFADGEYVKFDLGAYKRMIGNVKAIGKSGWDPPYLTSYLRNSNLLRKIWRSYVMLILFLQSRQGRFHLVDTNMLIL